MTQLLTKIDVTLQVPVTVKAADGKEAERSTIALRRPKTRHAKQLAVLIGQDLVEILTDKPDAKIDGMELGKTIIARLLTADSLDGLMALVADMTGEDVSVIADIDLIDLPAVGMAFAGFFPALLSRMPSELLAISSSSASSTP